jgi:hypothetical protein
MPMDGALSEPDQAASGVCPDAFGIGVLYPEWEQKKREN